MTNGFYEKTPSLSLRLRVARHAQAQRLTSNNLEYDSSSFEIIRGSEDRRTSGISNALEFSRIFSNKVERRKDVAHG